MIHISPSISSLMSLLILLLRLFIAKKKYYRIFLPWVRVTIELVSIPNKNYDKYRISEKIRLKWLRALRLISNQRLEMRDLCIANVIDGNRCDKDNITLLFRSKMTHNPYVKKRQANSSKGPHDFSFYVKIHSNNTNSKQNNNLQTFWLHIKIIDRWRCMKREKSMLARSKTFQRKFENVERGIFFFGIKSELFEFIWVKFWR